jgi:hypothetical protein
MTAFLLAAVVTLVFAALRAAEPVSTLILGSPGSGKSFSAFPAAIREVGVYADPHKDSLGSLIVEHGPEHRLLPDDFSGDHPLAFDLGKPAATEEGSYNRAMLLVAVFLAVRNLETSSGSALMDDWLPPAVYCYLTLRRRRRLSWLPYLFRPGTKRFRIMMRDCTQPDLKYKFLGLAKLTERGLRAEVGSIVRLLDSVFRSPSFRRRCDGHLDVGALLQAGNLIVLSRGEASEDAYRFYVLALLMLVVEHVKTRGTRYPFVRICLDEAMNAGFLRHPAPFKAAAECRKNGLFLTVITQALPSWADDLFQFCPLHVYHRIDSEAIARRAANDILPCLRLRPDETRAELIAWLIEDLKSLKPGERWVVRNGVARREYVKLPQSPWPDWPGLRAAKLSEKLERIYRKEEYRCPQPPDDEPPSSSSSPDTPPPSPSSPSPSSAAGRLVRAKRSAAGGSSSGGDAGGSS